MKNVYTVLNHRSREAIVAHLDEAGIDTAAYENSGQLMILNQLAFPEVTDQERLSQVEELYIAFITQCLAEGYPAVRFTGESLYTMTSCAPSFNLVETNSRCNTYIFPYYPLVCLCQYDRWKTDPALLKDAIISHPIIIKNGYFFQNFPNIPDENFLSTTSERWEAEYWLKTIERENQERDGLQLLSHSVENSAQPMLAVSPDGKLLRYNDAFRELIGLTDLQLQNLQHIFPPWNYYFREITEAIGQSAGYHRLTKEFPGEGGQPVILDLAIYKKYDYAGNLAFYYGSVTDISGQLAAEEALRKSEAKYRLIAENAYDMICIIDKDLFTLKYLSPSNKRILGYKNEELIGQNPLLKIHPDDYSWTVAKILEGIPLGGGTAQYRWLKKDGSYIWLESSGKIIVQDEYAGDILLVSRDISEKVQADRALQKELDYKNYLIDSMNEVFVTYDSSARITFVNSSATRVLGYDPQELLGVPVLDFLAAGGKSLAAEQVRNRLQKGEAGIFETTVLRKDGSECLARIKSSPIIENGVILGSMLLLEDISEIRKIEREMARLSQLHTIGEMAAGIGHEIRNPMTTVKGFLQIMGENEDFSKHRPYFNIMLEELERANEIISEFLALAKNKRVDLKLRDLNDIITAIYPLLQADATLGDKGIYLDLQEDVPELFLDEKEIRQLLINLVRNGLEAMEPGGNILISTYPEEGSVILSVRDEGKGIAPELLNKLGTPFFTTKESGTGLGLAVCYSIAARHQASIEPMSNSSGTIFMIRFKTSESPIQMKLPLNYSDLGSGL